MMSKPLLSAVIINGAFLFAQSAVFAAVPVVESQAVHQTTSANATPLTIQQAPNVANNTELMQSLVFQVQQLQRTVAEQNGQIEELSYRLEMLQQEQKQRYIDIDGRIQSLQAEPAVSQSAQQAALSPLSDDEILAQYTAATTLMQEKQFDQAIAQLEAFAANYPEHPLTANAIYWTGEIHLVQRNTAAATAAFETVVNDYTEHSKTPDSLYKLGVIAQQSADAELAKSYFERVIEEYPSSQSAKLSSARLSNN
ncbi:tol-pal system protein YbgF [Reinekea thalattae]|uniref:Cell division coordinator CpoB n=1 Tax=Reinekea thalattae TaxID=2593301 RepID=A0A5C8Z9Q8_9GAMM|nr:tol-pal system protein YbgF [Reinekea thalattae]TXR54019.1 tol-pal system protein YbgF [Reinekea thalattae]